MKNYAKVGNKPGKPAYRTASSFRNKKSFELSKIKRDNNGWQRQPKNRY